MLIYTELMHIYEFMIEMYILQEKALDDYK